jgi:uncharacterized protein DUF6868
MKMPARRPLPTPEEPMDTVGLTRFLVYCAVTNYAVLIVWFLAFIAAHDQLYRLHAMWFRLSPEGFDAMHYGGMAIYKLGILLFTVAPAVALYLTRM